MTMTHRSAVTFLSSLGFIPGWLERQPADEVILMAEEKRRELPRGRFSRYAETDDEGDDDMAAYDDDETTDTGDLTDDDFDQICEELSKRRDLWPQVLRLLTERDAPQKSPIGMSELGKVRKYSEKHRAELAKCGITPAEFQRVFIRSKLSADEYLRGGHNG